MPAIAAPSGRGIAAASQWHHVVLPSWRGSVWDACHAFLQPKALGAAGTAEFVEPDLMQSWPVESPPLAAGDQPDEQDTRYPCIPGDNDWYRDDNHGRFRKALEALGPNPPVVRIAHLDTGYDPNHHALPANLRTGLAKSFLSDPPLDNAYDVSHGLLNNLGHGTGTMSVLAGRNPTDPTKPVGAAPFVEIVPIRVADRVELFYNSAIAKALDYVFALSKNEETRIHIVTMSMGGLASQAWADAINALYEQGIFVVTAAGNNFGNLPTRYIVFPARFNRVTAACGAMANFTPYADLPLSKMAGNYGPSSKMRTAMAAYTPNTPWARFGKADIVDHDGGGTSAATPQIAAAAAFWIAKNYAAWKAYPQGWMRVEAIRKALFSTADKKEEKHFGQGQLKSDAAMVVVPKQSELKAEDKDDADFALLRVLFGFGAAAADAKQRMLELEALQLIQAGGHEGLIPDQPTRQSLLPLAKTLAADPHASKALRDALNAAIGQTPPSGTKTPKPAALPGHFQPFQAAHLQQALNPVVEQPKRRKLRAYAYDPSLGTSLDTLGNNEAVLSIRWEKLLPGPIGEYLEVVDVDPASGACYAPVDLNDPWILAEQGLAPSETDPRFHQQMAYAVASRTIEHFERALGRVALWAPLRTRQPGANGYVQRLRIYPHALRQANAFYSPEKKALLLGYFNAASANPGENAPGALVFTALSHDIIAHETTHALLDGLHRRYIEATNPDVLAFHEAFADIVALFQHFTLPEALKSQIRRTRGDLGKQSLLGELAVQFGHAMGGYGALRDAIGQHDENGVWHARPPSVDDYAKGRAQSDPHQLGAILVAAVFDAFLQIYKNRTADLIRLASGGTGILTGALSDDLTQRLAEEAAQIAATCLEICIRALDYCPPVDITFADYLRALVTADRDIAPEDPLGYRVAFVAGFRARGITPIEVRAVSAESLVWDPPPNQLTGLTTVLGEMALDWGMNSDRQKAYQTSRNNAYKFWRWLTSDAVSDEELAMLGLVRHACDMELGGVAGKLGGIEVHSVRPVRRIGPDRLSHDELVIEITQTWRKTVAADEAPQSFRGGCTLVVNLQTGLPLYLVRKRVDHDGRFQTQTAFQAAVSMTTLRANYADDRESQTEPFAALHDAY